MNQLKMFDEITELSRFDLGWISGVSIPNDALELKEEKENESDVSMNDVLPPRDRNTLGWLLLCSEVTPVDEDKIGTGASDALGDELKEGVEE